MPHREAPHQELPSSGPGGNARAKLFSVLNALASLNLALVVLVALGAGVLIAYLSEVRTTWSLVVPLMAFVVNLSAAIATKPGFRRQTPLLVFHLALIAIVLLIAIGRLTYLKGTLELTDGALFDGTLTTSEAGPWHRGNLEDVRFANEGFEIDYAQATLPAEPALNMIVPNNQPAAAASAPAADAQISDTRGVRRGATRNRVRWFDESGGEHAAQIGDHEPLIIRGYRFYTSANKGFAPVFVWLPDNGGPVKGVIHLPAYPMHEYKQILEWTPPGSTLNLWTQLQFDEIILNPTRPSQFRIPKRHKIVIRHGADRHELVPGSRVKLPGGVLLYDSLTTWMGYTVFYDWTIGWLLGSCILAVLSLAWFFWQKYAVRPW